MKITFFDFLIYYVEKRKPIKVKSSPLALILRICLMTSVSY